MPPRERRPPTWTSDYVIEEPIEESTQPWTGRTRSGRHVNPPSRFIADESPSFAASAITPRSGRSRAGARPSAPTNTPDTPGPSIDRWARIVERLRVQYEQLHVAEDSDSGLSSETDDVIAQDSGSNYIPSQGTGSRGSSVASEAPEEPLLAEERQREDMPIGWGAARDVSTHYVGRFDKVCPSCQAVLWPGESRTICCPSNNNAAKVEMLRSIFTQPPPEPLEQLLVFIPGSGTTVCSLSAFGLITMLYLLLPLPFRSQIFACKVLSILKCMEVFIISFLP